MSSTGDSEFRTGRDLERDKHSSKISVPNAEESEDFYYGKFPEGFLWGCSTSAVQVEGGSNADGKGESDWDHFVRKNPDRIDDKSTPEVAADSYHRYKEDVQLLKNMGASAYRFSISWPRVLPNGTADCVNEAGFEYYRNLLDELLKNGIQPIVTLYHWDLPQPLAEKYSWADEEMIEIFADYARIVFEKLGDKVPYFITLNEPWIFAIAGFNLGVFAPFRNDDTVVVYRVLHNFLKAHATVYRLYEEEFKAKFNGKIGASLECWWTEPMDPNNPDDVKAARRAADFKFGAAAWPLIHGCYPPVMREYIDRKSKEEGRPESRLPHFDDEWAAKLKGTLDFIGLNHYSSELITTPERAPKDVQEVKWTKGHPSVDSDQDIFQYHDPSWPATPSWWCKYTPWGFRKLLNHIKDEYGNIEVIVAENGCSGEPEEMEDSNRLNYFKGYLNEMLKAVNVDGCNVTGYCAWSLIDGWEWAAGHSVTFGVHHVDLSDPNRKRTPRASAKYLTKIFKDNGFVKS